MEKISNWLSKIFRTMIWATIITVTLVYRGWVDIQVNGSQIVQDIRLIQASVFGTPNHQNSSPIHSVDRPDRGYLEYQDDLIYRVQPGETLGTIARKFDINYELIRQINGIREPNNLRYGQPIRIPRTR